MVLDPRSERPFDHLARTLVWTRRYPEARSAANRGLAVDPAALSLIQDRAMSLLGEGDLAGARSSLRDVPATLDRSALDAYMANYFDMYWALDSADRAVVLALPPFRIRRRSWCMGHRTR